ncbi:protein kintoun [Skeletonema marinoi]|uniref:Protein kintoun n=1 Tax=Skeletonema marinoi TaxID=267567 RepID=A0AAD8YKL3_9STRA|nr:protein kintoun [Skeletonema marinoi]
MAENADTAAPPPRRGKFLSGPPPAATAAASTTTASTAAPAKQTRGKFLNSTTTTTTSSTTLTSTNSTNTSTIISNETSLTTLKQQIHQAKIVASTRRRAISSSRNEVFQDLEQAETIVLALLQCASEVRSNGVGYLAGVTKLHELLAPHASLVKSYRNHTSAAAAANNSNINNNTNGAEAGSSDETTNNTNGQPTQQSSELASFNPNSSEIVKMATSNMYAARVEKRLAFDAAFKSEEFRRLMADYVDSLSDPSNREEQEAYITHLEANKELPPGKSLIRPNAGFVVKCSLVREDTTLDASSSSSSSSSQSQARWSVPYAIGPVRMEHDKSNNLVPTFDVCFHPLSLQYAHARKEFCDMVIGISQSAVVEAYSKASGEDVKIDSYAILKNVRYKNGAPKALIVGSYDQSLPDGVKEDLSVQPDDSSDFAETEKAADATAYTRSSADEELKKHTDKEAESTDSIIIPKYKIVEQGMLELTNHHDSSRRPKQLIVNVHLDKIASATEIDLLVSETKVEVGAKLKTLIT